jgi:Tol biopolymer transport system component
MLRRLLPIASLCALAVPATAGAAFPGANGAIVFDRGGSILTSAGVTLSATGYDFAPKYSPDGSQVAYAVNRDIWVMDADGSHKRQLTKDGAYNRDPDWSPDSKRIAYVGSGAGDRADIFSIPVTGGSATPITTTDDHDETDPAYSPDGKRVAYTRTGCEIPRGGGTCVYVTGATGGAASNLTPEDSIDGCENQPGYYFNGATRSPSWSPDGKRIAFNGPLLCKVSSLGTDIWVMNADGSGKTNLTHDDGTNDVEPAFSPDGTQIAFARNSHSGPTNVHVINGSAITQLTNGGDDRNPDWGVAPKHCVVPKLKKATLAEAKARLPLMGCKPGKVTRKKTKAPKGTVVAQAIKAGTIVKLGTKVALTIDK